jgi:hypothetical protein
MINVYWLSCELPDIVVIFNDTLIFLTDFLKIRVKFLANPFIGIRVFPCGRTDSQTRDANSRLRNFANAPKCINI